MFPKLAPKHKCRLMRTSLLSDWLQHVKGEITKIDASESWFLHIAVFFLMRDTLTDM